MNTPDSYDALLIVSFGGPEGPDDVMPFLQNVLRGKNVPNERMLEVAQHYQHFGGVSPINHQCRELIKAVNAELKINGPDLPIYWGNRNWHPMLADTIRQMKEDGVQRVLAFTTSAYSSYSGCRQYREDIEQARAEVGEGAPHVDKLRVFYNHPGFVEAMAERVQDALARIPEQRRETTQLVYTAHSIPTAMVDGCDYVAQLNEASRLVTECLRLRVGEFNSKLVYQSRSGPPNQPWLEPDICDYLTEVYTRGDFSDVVIVPIGFISDHMEVLFDLDTEARKLCDQLGLNMVRAKSVGTHPKFIKMIRELISERISGTERRSLGPSHDACPKDCCLSGRVAHRPMETAEVDSLSAKPACPSPTHS